MPTWYCAEYLIFFLPVFTLPYVFKGYPRHFICIQLIILNDTYDSICVICKFSLPVPPLQTPDCLNFRLLQQALQLTYLFMTLDSWSL